MSDHSPRRDESSETITLSSVHGGDPAIHTSDYTSAEHNRRAAFASVSGDDKTKEDLDRGKLHNYLTGRRWLGLLFVNAVLGFNNGYDVSNLANLQIPIYQAFGHIELLPWISLSYSVCNVAAIPLARKLTQFYDLKLLGLVSLVFIAAGAAVGGAAPNIESVIVGRAITAIGSSVVYQCALNFTVLFSPPERLALGQAVLGAIFAVGLITGPIIGGAFADSEHATWRWGFYFIIPLCVMGFISLATSLPRYRNPSNLSPLAQVKEVDWIGNILHMGTFLFLAAGCTSSGPIWSWNSAPSIVIWILFPLFLIAYIVQQYLSLGTKPDLRIFPCWLLGNKTVTCVSICTACAAMAYGVTLYYLPIYFAFAHNLGPLEAAVRMLPFICTFIVLIFLAAGLLRAIKYYMVLYLLAGAFMIAGGALLYTIEPDTSEAAVMGYTVLVGIGAGLIFQAGIPVCSPILPPGQRLDQAALHNISQLGGVAISLSLAGVIYQNVGVQLLREAVGSVDYTDEDIRVLLAGAASPILAHGDPALHDEVVGAITELISRCFLILVVAGALCLVSACFLRWEPLKVNKPGPEETESGTVLEEGK